jgi:hypothetical protein
VRVVVTLEPLEGEMLGYMWARHCGEIIKALQVQAQWYPRDRCQI